MISSQPVRMAVSQKITTYAVEHLDRREPLSAAPGNAYSFRTWKSVWRFIKNQNQIYSIAQWNHSQCVSKGLQVNKSQRNLHVKCAKLQSQHRCPLTDRCTRKMWHTHIIDLSQPWTIVILFEGKWDRTRSKYSKKIKLVSEGQTFMLSRS